MFRKEYSTLRNALQTPEWLAAELYSKDIINEDTKEDVLLITLTRYKKCEVLLDAVGRRIAADPRQFHEFVSILQQEPSLSHVCQLLQNGYRKSALGPRAINPMQSE